MVNWSDEDNEEKTLKTHFEEITKHDAMLVFNHIIILYNIYIVKWKLN